MKKSLLCLLLACASAIGHAQLVSFDFTGCPCSTFAGDAAANVQTPVTFSRGSGIGSNAGGDYFNSTGFNTSSPSSQTLATAQAQNDFHSFSIAPAAGYQITYASVTFPQQRSSAGPVKSMIGFSTNGGTSWTYSPEFSVGTGMANASWDFTDFTTANTVIFRIWAWGATNSGGTYRNDDVVLNGSVTTTVTPLVTTLAATDTAINSLTFSGTVNARGISTTNTFQYGTTASVTSTINASPSTLSTSVLTTISATATGLLPNTLYYYRARGANSSNSATGTTFQVYTLANTPGTPIVNGSTSGSLNVTIQTNSNPAATRYAIYENTTGQYVQADGTLGATPVWQSAATWASPVTVTGLSESTPYSFQTQAINGNDVETPLSASAAGTTSVGAPLPVRFADIYVKSVNNHREIGWTNLTELDVRHYIVERAGENGVFAAVATIAARSNQSDKVVYRWNDETTNATVRYYRIRAVEFSGQELYSDIVRLESNSVAGKSLTVRPNPVQGDVIRYQADVKAGRYQIALYNASGLRVINRKQALGEGVNSLSLEVGGLAAGIYVLELRNADGTVAGRQSVVR
jgi:hypothetical protein